MEDITSEMYLGFLLRGLVQNPQAIEITKNVSEMGVELKVKADRSDFGIIVGRKGAMIQALAHIMRSFGMKNRANISIKLDDGKIERSGMPSDLNNATKRVVLNP